MPEVVPGANLDHRRICSFCRVSEADATARSDSLRRTMEEDLEKTLLECRGKREYDCLVPVSGGKDSLYLLYKLKIEYGLNVLAFTTDINIPDLAWRNIGRTTRKLDIFHVAYRPPHGFITKLFRYLLQNQEERGAVYTVSYVYAPLFEGDAIKLALEKGIPLILAGYSPGQPIPERMLYEFSRKLICETDWTPPKLRDSGVFTETELSCFFDPRRYPPGTRFPRYLAPFHAWHYNQTDAIRTVVNKGLVTNSKHASPISTNYPINWLLMYSDLRHFGYNPYHPEFSALIREGRASRTYWRIVGPIVNLMILKRAYLGRNVTRCLRWLQLDVDDLKITCAKGAYDPIVSL